MRKLITRWTVLMAIVAGTIAGVEHRLATLPPTPPHPPSMVSAASFTLE